MTGNISKVNITSDMAEKLNGLKTNYIFLEGLAKVQNIGENRSINGPTTTGTVVFNDDGYTLTGVCDVRRWVHNCPVEQAVGGEGTTLSLEIDLPGGNGGRIFYVYSQEQGVEGRNPMFGFAYTTQGYRLLSNFSTSLSNDQYYNDKIYKGTVSVWVFIKGGDFELYVNEERITRISTGTNLSNRWYYGFRTYLGTEAVTIKNMKYSKGNAVRKTFETESKSFDIFTIEKLDDWGKIERTDPFAGIMYIPEHFFANSQAAMASGDMRDAYSAEYFGSRTYNALIVSGQYDYEEDIDGNISSRVINQTITFEDGSIYGRDITYHEDDGSWSFSPIRQIRDSGTADAERMRTPILTAPNGQAYSLHVRDDGTLWTDEELFG